jgi:hypothetical protein
VRTRLIIENDVAAQLRAEAQRTGRPFKDVVNECLRRGLAQHDRPQIAAVFTVKPRDMGPLQSGAALAGVAGLLERLEGPGRA